LETCSVYICIYGNACMCIWIYVPHVRENMWHLSFWIWLTSLNIIFRSIHLPANDKFSFFFRARWYSIMYVYITFS
jgi:hypothetical protein